MLGLFPTELIFISLTICFLLTLASYLSQAPKRDITAWEALIKADDPAKRSQQKEEKKLRKIQRLRKKAKGRRRVDLEVLEQRQREKIQAIREDYDKLVRETYEQLSSESRQKHFAAEDYKRACGQIADLRNQLDRIHVSTGKMTAQLKKEQSMVKFAHSRLESRVIELESKIKELETDIKHEIIEKEGEQASREEYIKAWKYTRYTMLDVCKGSDTESFKLKQLEYLLMGLTEPNYTLVNAAAEDPRRHAQMVDPRAEEIANRVREAARLDRGRVFVNGYLKGIEHGRLICW